MPMKNIENAGGSMWLAMGLVLFFGIVALLIVVLIEQIWDSRSYLASRGTYYGVTFLAFGLGVMLLVYQVVSHGGLGIGLFFVLEMVMACLLVWWHYQRSLIIGEIEEFFFDRRHERHICEDLGLIPTRR